MRGLYSSRHHLKKFLSITQRNYILINVSISTIYLINLFYPFIHLSEPKRDVYHSPKTSLLRQTILGMEAREKMQRQRQAGMDSCVRQKRPRVHRLSPPDLTCVADQAPSLLLGCPSTWRGPKLSGQMSDSQESFMKISAMTLMFILLFSPSLSPLLFTFLLLFICFPSSLLPLLCRPPIMVINLAIIFLIFISCSLSAGIGQREWLSFSNVSHFLTHPTDMFTDGTHHYWKYFVYLFIFYCLFPSN